MCDQLSSDEDTSLASRSTTPDITGLASRPPTPEIAIYNPDRAIFEARRRSLTGSRRHSLAELLPDWPSLEHQDKPEYKMPEVMCLWNM